MQCPDFEKIDEIYVTNNQYREYLKGTTSHAVREFADFNSTCWIWLVTSLKLMRHACWWDNQQLVIPVINFEK